MYLIKALTGFLLPPGLFVVILAVLGVVFIRRGQGGGSALLVVAAIIYLCAVPLTSNLLMRTLERYASPPAKVSGDVIVMLGGGATPDTPDVEGTGMLSGSGANRLLTTARLYRETGLPVLVSGGQVYVDDGVEADIAKRQLVSLGVPAERILVEADSRNTAENAKRSKQLLAEHHLTHPVLVTSAFHMQRSVLEFRKQGIAVQPYPCDYQVSTKVRWYPNLLVPGGSAMNLTWTALHEYLGMLGAKL